VAYSNCGASCHIAHFDPLTHPGRRGLGGVHARWQRAYKPLLGVADTNHLLNIHILVMLGNAEELIQVRKWLRVLLDPVPTCMYATKAMTARVGIRGSK